MRVKIEEYTNDVFVLNEVCRVLPDIPRSWLLFVSEHLRCSTFNDFFESLRMLRGILAGNHTVFGATSWFSRSVLQETINISQSLQNGT